MRYRISILAILVLLLIGFGTHNAKAQAQPEGEEDDFAVIFIGGWTSQNTTADADSLDGYAAMREAIADDSRLNDRIKLEDFKSFGYAGDDQLLPMLSRGADSDDQAAGSTAGTDQLAANVEEWSIALSTLVESLPNKRIVIIAHSIGGVVATYWAATAPERLVSQVDLIVAISSPLQGTNWGALARVTQIAELTASHTLIQTLQTAPQRVKVFTIRNQDDWVVTAEEATISGAWKELVGPFSFLAGINPYALINQLLRLDEDKLEQEAIDQLAQDVLAGHSSATSHASVANAIVDAIVDAIIEVEESDQITPAAAIDAARFVTDITLPISATVSPGQLIQKVWRLQNSGETTWEKYQLVFQSGTKLGAPTVVDMPRTLPQQHVDVGFPLQIPADLKSGTYRSVWRLRNRLGKLFGPQITLQVNVQGQGPDPLTDPPTVQEPISVTTHLITDFETWQNWSHGDEGWGAFTQSQVQVYRGDFAGKLSYDFPAVDNNYLVFHHEIPLAGQPTALRVWVYGDGSGNYLNVWLKDALDHLWQFSFGQIDHSGWLEMQAPFSTDAGWPNEALDASGAAQPAYPVQLYALVLDSVVEGAGSTGTLYLDDLSVEGAGVVPVANVECVSSPPPPVDRRGDTLIADFEEWGDWARGDQTWGVFVQTSDEVYGGSYAGKFSYIFPAVAENFVVFRHDLPIQGKPASLRMRVYGDGSQNFVNAWIEDASGHLWQITFGRVLHRGWKEMFAPISIDSGWPNGSLQGTPDAEFRYPLRLYALVVDGYREDIPLSGTIYVDDLYASDVTEAEIQAADCTSP